MKTQLKSIIFPAVASVALLVSSTAKADLAELEGAAKDAWLGGKLDTIVVFNEHLSPFDIDTKVIDGVAYVAGSVDSYYQKMLASDLFDDIDGIRSVENQLVVRTQPDPSATEELAGTLHSATIETAVDTKLLLNPQVDGTEIDVRANAAEGLVELRGTVGTRYESELAEQIAINTFDVTEVVNYLTVLN